MDEKKLRDLISEQPDPEKFKLLEQVLSEWVELLSRVPTPAPPAA